MLLRLTHIAFVAVLLAALVSCENNSAIKHKGGDTLDIQYSRLLTIERCEGYKLVTVADPWKENAVLHRYALVERNSAIPSGLDADVTVLRVPLKKICVSTSVHVNVFKQLNALENVASVCDTEYILDSLVLARVKNGIIGNAGSSMNPNIEQIIAFDTDALLMSPFKGTSYGLLEKTGLPIVECADYMETSALGRAEWIKFYGMLVGKESQSIEYFNGVRDRYLKLKNAAAKAARRPRLLVDMLNGSTWFQPGGNSIYGAMFRDAAADYSMGCKDVSGTQALSLESVMKQSLDADVWLIKYGRTQDYTYQSLAGQNKAYTRFKAYKTHKIFACNTFKTAYYDEVPFRPDLLLADLVEIFHPGLLPNHKLNYYLPLD